jgi:SAM-dependent methyltransferase
LRHAITLDVVDARAVSEGYTALADQYIQLFGSAERMHQDDLAFIRRHLGRLSGPVVDAGCGPGHLTNYLQGLGVDVTGIDIVPSFIAHAETAYPSCRFELRSLTAPDSFPEPLAGALAWYSLIHFAPAQVAPVLAGFRRAINPGGTLVLGLFAGDHLVAFDHKVTTAYFWSAAEARTLLNDAGFAVVETLQRTDESTRRPLLALAAHAF